MGRHFERGMALYQMERYSESIAEFNQELSEEPECALSFAMRGASLLNLGRLRNAEEDLRQSLSIEPEFSYAYFVLSLLYRRREEYSAAEKAILEALRLDHQPRYFRQLASVLNDQGREKEAIQASKKALEMDPTDEMSLVAHGTYLYAAGNSEEAEKLLLEARAINPELANAHFAIGMFDLLHRRACRSSESLQDARRLAPTRFNKAEPIALSYVLKIWPFRWLRYVIPWWPGWSRDKQWCLMAVLCTIALAISWGFHFETSRWVHYALPIFLVLVNLSIVPITIGNIAHISATLFEYQSPKLHGFVFWKVIVACGLVAMFCQYLATTLGRLCASFPPLPFLVLAAFSYRRFFHLFLRMETILRGLIYLFVGFFLLTPVVVGVFASVLDLKLGMAISAATKTPRMPSRMS